MDVGDDRSDDPEDDGVLIMDLRLKIIAGILLTVFVIIVFVFALPSLLGTLLTCLAVVALYDFFARKRRHATRTFNSALRSVCHHKDAVQKIVTAFARQGPLRGPCYEYARRLIAGEDPIKAAAASQLPLQLGTAVAMSTDGSVPPHEERDYPENGRPEGTYLPPYTQIIYLTLATLIICGLLSFITTMIVPTVVWMYDEYGVSLERYEYLIRGPTPAWILLTITALLLLVMIPVMLRASALSATELNWLPIAPHAAESRAELLSGFADAIEAGMPLLGAIELAGLISTDYRQKLSLYKAASSMKLGTSAVDALYQNGWLTGNELAWLRDAPPHRFAQLLRHFGRQGVRDAQANLQWIMGILFPLLVVVLGAAVLSYAYGFLGAIMNLFGMLA